MILLNLILRSVILRMFFYNHSPTTELYTYCHTLTLHDALPIFHQPAQPGQRLRSDGGLHQRRVAGSDLRLQLVRLVREHAGRLDAGGSRRSEEHSSELQSLMRISYAVFCLKKKNQTNNIQINITQVYTYTYKLISYEH